MTIRRTFDLQVLLPAISYHVSFSEERYCDPRLSPLVIRELRLTLPQHRAAAAGISRSCRLLSQRAAALGAARIPPAGAAGIC